MQGTDSVDGSVVLLSVNAWVGFEVILHSQTLPRLLAQSLELRQLMTLANLSNLFTVYLSLCTLNPHALPIPKQHVMM